MLNILNWLDYGARMYDPVTCRWWAQDPLAEKYYSWSPYNYVLDNPINSIDPNGMWEYKLNKDEEGNEHLELVKSKEKDNWRTFKRESGLSKKELKSMFGDDYKEKLNSVGFNEEGVNYSENQAIGTDEISGDYGNMLKEVETALVEYNANGDLLKENNCFGTVLSLRMMGEIDQKAYRKHSQFDQTLNSYFNNNDSREKLGDIFVYASNNGNGMTTHASILLLKSNNEKGAQQFSKDGKGKYVLYHQNQTQKGGVWDTRSKKFPGNWRNNN